MVDSTKAPTVAALTVAGSDSGGGAGIQADLKTFAAHGVLGTCAITALTAQNTLGVRGVMVVEPGFVVAQIEAVLADLPVRAVKTGMLANAAVTRAVVEAFAGRDLPLVVDPVCVATSGDPLLDDDGLIALRDGLLPLATVITPNVPEAALLLDDPDAVRRPPSEVARALQRLAPNATVLLKGGHRADAPRSMDLARFPDGRELELDAPRVATTSTHGTGCTLSSAIAANLSLGATIEEALSRAKAYITGALRHARPIGGGHGPVHHFWSWRAGREP